MIWKAILGALNPVIPLASLVKNNVDDFVVFADILRWDWHEFVDHLAEQRYIALCIAPYPCDQFSYGLFLLYGGVSVETCIEMRSYLCNVLQVY